MTTTPIAGDDAGADARSAAAVRRRPAAEPLPHITALDGLRAIAVVLVLLYHADFTWLTGGFLGVSVFFTLSGFLITSLLLREWWEHGAVDGRRFWGRRLRRLTPASWTAIIVVLLAGVFSVWDTEQLRDLRSDVPWSLVDLVNWHFITSGTTYGDSFAAPSPLEHFWSLAVETQFYAILLLVVMGVLILGRGRSRQVRLNRLIAVLAAATVASATANLLLARNSIDRAYFGTDTRAAEMLIGALLACVMLRQLQLPTPQARTRSMAAAVVALGGILAMSHFATLDSGWLYPWGLLATALCTAALVVGLIQGGPLARVLSTRPLVGLGRISYGVYVLHWPIFLWLTPYRTGLGVWALFGLRMLVVIPASLALFHLIEMPMRSRRWPAGRTLAVLAPLTVLAMLVATFTLTRDLPAPPTFLKERDAGAISVDEAGGPTTTAPAGPRRPTRVLLVGDSIAASLEAALSASLTSRGVSFATVAMPGCGVITGEPANGPGDPVLDVGGSSIADCATTLPDRQDAAIAAFHPDLVVSLSTWEGVDRIVDGIFYAFGDSNADAKLTELFAQTTARLGADGAAVAYVLLPDTVAGRTTRAGEPSPEDVARSSHLRDLLLQVTTQVPGTTTLDMASVVCPITPCPTEVDGISLRPTDGIHYDDEAGAALVADALANQVMAIDLDTVRPPGS